MPPRRLNRRRRTAAPACMEAPSGLVAWLPGDGNANEIQARQDGIAQNGASFAPAMAGQGFSLNGVDQYVRCCRTRRTSIRAPGRSPCDAWIKTSVMGRASVVSKHECGNSCFAGSNSAYELFLDSFGHAAGFLRDSDFFGGGLEVAGTTVVTDGAFHHLAMIAGHRGRRITPVRRRRPGGPQRPERGLRRHHQGRRPGPHDDLLIGARSQGSNPEPGELLLRPHRRGPTLRPRSRRHRSRDHIRRRE